MLDPPLLGKVTLLFLMFYLIESIIRQFLMQSYNNSNNTDNQFCSNLFLTNVFSIGLSVLCKICMYLIHIYY